MSLADRLAQARRDRAQAASPSADTPPPTTANPLASRARQSVTMDPFVDIKREVHQSLLETLGPKLYDTKLIKNDGNFRILKGFITILKVI